MQQFVVIWHWRGVINSVRGPFVDEQEAHEYIRAKLPQEVESRYEVRLVYR